MNRWKARGKPGILKIEEETWGSREENCNRKGVSCPPRKDQWEAFVIGNQTQVKIINDKSPEQWGRKWHILWAQL